VAALRRTAIGLVALVAAIGLQGVGSASASSIYVSNGVLSYNGGSTEANHATFSFEMQYGVYVIQDTGVSSIYVPSYGANGCHSYTPQIAYCDYGAFTSITARLGNGGSFAQSKLTVTPVTMYAGAGNNTLIAGGGADTLIGGSGTTTMTAGTGRATYKGGSGTDVIDARNGVAEDISCGAGADTVTEDSDDNAAGDCESVNRAGGSSAPSTSGTTPTSTPVNPDLGTALPTFAPPLPVISTTPVTLRANNRVPVRVGCPADAAGGCVGSIALALANAEKAGKVIAARRVKRRLVSRRRHFRLAAGKEVVVPVALSRRGGHAVRRALRGHRKVRIAVTISMRSEAGTQETTKTIVVRAERRSGGMKSRKSRKSRRRRH
jgi:hypothetical protein